MTFVQKKKKIGEKENWKFWRECSLGIRLIYILFPAISNKIFQAFKTLKDLEPPINYL